MKIAHLIQSRYVLAILILLVATGLLLEHFNAPWFGHHDANGVWLSAASRNARTYDNLEYPLVPLINLGPIPAEVPRWYVHHPPLIVWTVTLANQVFGDYPLAPRFVSVLSTLIAIAGFYVFCRRLYNQKQALLCVMLFTFTPMIIFFGRMPNHEPMSLAFLMASLAIFINWYRRPTPGRWYALIITIILAVWSAWATVFFFAFIFLFCWIIATRSIRFKLFILGAISVASVGSVMVFFQLIYPDTIHELLRTFIWRTSTVSEISTDFTWLEFIGQTFIHLLPHASIGVLLTGLIGIVPSWRNENRFNRALIFAFAAGGLLYVIVFRSASYVHDYYKIYLMPFLAICSANAIYYALENRNIRRWASPALLGLFVVSFGFSAVYLRGLYLNERGDAMVAIANTIAEHTERDDLVITNMGPANPTIQYYAFRNIVWDVMPDEIQTAREDNSTRAVYFYCGDSTNLPAGERITDDDCEIVYLE